MHGYGLPRNDDVQNPDVSDIQLYGLRGHGHRFHKAQTEVNARRWWWARVRIPLAILFLIGEVYE